MGNTTKRDPEYYKTLPPSKARGTAKSPRAFMKTKKGGVSHLKNIDKQFADEYMRNGEVGAAAVRKVYKGLDPNSSYVYDKARRILGKPAVRAYIQQLEQQIIVEAAPSVAKLAEVRDTSDSDMAVIRASQQILDSYDKVMKRHEKPEAEGRQVTNNVLLMNMSDDELTSKIKDLTSRLVEVEADVE